MARPRKTTAGPKVGDVVQYGGNRYALIVEDAGGDGKHQLLVLEGSVVPSTRRDPKDYDAEGAGTTWHPLG